MLPPKSPVAMAESHGAAFVVDVASSSDVGDLLLLRFASHS
jgi:hypothetical protein